MNARDLAGKARRVLAEVARDTAREYHECGQRAMATAMFREAERLDAAAIRFDELRERAAMRSACGECRCGAHGECLGEGCQCPRCTKGGAP